jgi:hypothetical protein
MAISIILPCGETLPITKLVGSGGRHPRKKSINNPEKPKNPALAYLQDEYWYEKVVRLSHIEPFDFAKVHELIPDISYREFLRLVSHNFFVKTCDGYFIQKEVIERIKNFYRNKQKNQDRKNRKNMF